jgi:hypothetical protein
MTPLIDQQQFDIVLVKDILLCLKFNIKIK